MKYSIYQLRENSQLLFLSYDALKAKGVVAEAKNYRFIFAGEEDTETNALFETVISKYSGNQPKEYKGRPISVSDVIVIHMSATEEQAYYVDIDGFRKINFLIEKDMYLPDFDVFTDPRCVLENECFALYSKRRDNWFGIYHLENSGARLVSEIFGIEEAVKKLHEQMENASTVSSCNKSFIPSVRIEFPSFNLIRSYKEKFNEAATCYAF